MKTPFRFPFTLGSPFRRTTLPLSLLVTLSLWTFASGAGSQPEPTSAARITPAAQPAGSPGSVPAPAQSNSPPADGDLKFVVAVFRHGVRSPLKDLNANTPSHSGSRWPSLADWAGNNSGNWGDLTPHGATAVGLLGAWYGGTYSKAWGKSFKAYLWADTDERTVKTAAALATGFGPGISVTLGSLPPLKTDPLFHPFKAMCGTPSPTPMNGVAADIKAACLAGLVSYKDQLAKLASVLNCQNTNCNTTDPCQPLQCLQKNACAPTPAPATSPRPASPIIWDGEFSYASTVTEAFLLEYANNMANPAWGGADVGQISDLLRLHEFYFQQTERNPYLAGIGSANLVREILTQLNRKAGYPSKLDGKCPHGDGTEDFVGLVGHDTNLANLNALLKVKWNFNTPALPVDTRNVPENDALPAGALVFELRGAKPNYRVRIQYVAQSLKEIREAPKPANAYRVETTCNGKTPCEMTLDNFNTLAGIVINANGDFLSTCNNGTQTCL